MIFFNKRIFGWAMYDFANSSYSTVVITALYSVYFSKIVMNDTEQGTGELFWSITLSISYLITALLSPIIGAMADYQSIKKNLLMMTTFLCVVPTALLFFTFENTIILAMTLIIISNTGFSLGENLISSFLPEIAEKKDIGKVSGFGWGLGFIGGITALTGSLILLSVFENDKPFALRTTNLLTALFFFLATIPTFLWLNEKKRNSHSSNNITYIKAAFKRIIFTFKHIHHFKELSKLMLAFFLYNAGLMTVISFAALYAEEIFHFKPDELILLIILINITASIGAVLFGYIQDIVGSKKALEWTLFLWVITIAGVYLAQDKTTFWIITAFAGIGLGSIQSATRALVGLFTPDSKLAEFYGFWGVSGKLSAIPGLFAYGALSYLVGSQREALLSILIFFILGFIFIYKIDEKKGIKEAEQFIVE